MMDGCLKIIASHSDRNRVSIALSHRVYLQIWVLTKHVRQALGRNPPVMVRRSFRCLEAQQARYADLFFDGENPPQALDSRIRGNDMMSKHFDRAPPLHALNSRMSLPLWGREGHDEQACR